MSSDCDSQSSDSSDAVLNSPETEAKGVERQNNEHSAANHMLRNSPFSIANILAAPKVPRGRRPNSKYPRVQACKSANPFGLGMYPLHPVTQPVGFVIRQCHDEERIDETEIAETSDVVERSDDATKTENHAFHASKISSELLESKRKEEEEDVQSSEEEHQQQDSHMCPQSLLQDIDRLDEDDEEIDVN